MIPDCFHQHITILARCNVISVYIQLIQQRWPTLAFLLPKHSEEQISVLYTIPLVLPFKVSPSIVPSPWVIEMSMICQRTSHTAWQMRPILFFHPQRNFFWPTPTASASFIDGLCIQIRMPSTMPAQQSNFTLLALQNPPEPQADPEAKGSFCWQYPWISWHYRRRCSDGDGMEMDVMRKVQNYGKIFLHMDKVTYTVERQTKTYVTKYISMSSPCRPIDNDLGPHTDLQWRIE